MRSLTETAGAKKALKGARKDGEKSRVPKSAETQPSVRSRKEAAQGTSRRTAGQDAVQVKKRDSALSKKAATIAARAKKEAAIAEKSRRRPRTYSSRSKLSSFLVGDMVVFRRARDWSTSHSDFIELKGTVVGKGHDAQNGVNYIEVSFECESPSGVPATEIRRFFVK